MIRELSKIVISPVNIDKLILPEGYELRRVKTKAERIAELQVEIGKLEALKEPDEEELIELGKEIHPYYMTRMELDWQKQQLNELMG